MAARGLVWSVNVLTSPWNLTYPDPGPLLFSEKGRVVGVRFRKLQRQPSLQRKPGSLSVEIAWAGGNASDDRKISAPSSPAVPNAYLTIIHLRAILFSALKTLDFAAANAETQGQPRY